MTTATKLGYGQDTLTAVHPRERRDVRGLDVSKQGRFSFKMLHLTSDYGGEQVEEIIGLFVKMSAVK